MKFAILPATLLTSALLTLAAPALAREPLGDDPHIVNSLMSGRVADVIRNECSSISAKMFVVMGKLNDLETYARGKGYTEAEVKAFLKDKTEKDRIKAMATDYLAKAGAKPGDAESYCKVGRDEIAKGTLAGSLLRSWK
ncbi:DUF5333 domain-containing protein [Tabrizicola fusiformis]|uniref:DUF5333 domain-containing protein n=1 Tax=Tabrizicola sp. SY72 TaxID=2741673 RepID=UPI001571FC77|nr:DUF5333 domain-containing protein [Tabrizicola sp. SY72]NTT85799.1 DUF5333 domain-containing protein [Tabrizicola sp. SY72]